MIYDIDYVASRKSSADFDLSRLQIFVTEVSQLRGVNILNLKNVIHIAGTNGKGSTLSFIKNILMHHGFKVAAFVSPHIVDYRERISINDSYITAEYVNSKLQEYKNLKNFHSLSMFELTFALFCDMLNDKDYDYAVVEVGLGGRLDATNLILHKLINIITPIGFDHEDFLGDTIEKISREKLGICREGDDVIVAKQSYSEVYNYALKTLGALNCNILQFNKHWFTNGKTLTLPSGAKIEINNISLLGKHQIDNAASALCCAEHVLGNQFSALEALNALSTTVHLGRLTCLKDSALGVPINSNAYIDGSHNAMGVEALCNFIEDLNPPKKSLMLVMCMLRKKNFYQCLSILNSQSLYIDKVIVYVMDSETCIGKDQVNGVNLPVDASIEVIEDIENLQYIVSQHKGDLLFTGSLYFAGYVLSLSKT